MALLGCNRSEDAPSVPRPANASRPAAPVAAVDESQNLPANIDPVPELGQAKAQKMRDGEVWERYPDGLLVFEIRPGQGQKPQLGQKVTVAYTGTFVGGQEFDKATKEKPFTFQLGTRNVIKGWNLAVSTMQVGGRRKIWLPADLAYGAGGNPPLIPPNAPLIFDIELLSISGDAYQAPAVKFAVKPLGPATQPKGE
jgi:FKBP-type peptidyl-prolyl cis-trans isomerase